MIAALFKKHRYFSAAFLLIFSLLVILVWNYTKAIKNTNEIERERIALEERTREAERIRSEEQHRADFGLEEQKIELGRQVLEQRKQSAEQEYRERAAAAVATRTEALRKECRVVQVENRRQFDEFVSECTKYQPIESCLNSEGGKEFRDSLAPDWIQRCIKNKETTGW